MARPILTLAAVGVFSIAAWKLATIVVFPFFFTLLKVALVIGAIWLVVSWLRKDRNRKDDRKDSDAPAS